jgi:hypothetical protein
MTALLATTLLATTLLATTLLATTLLAASFKNACSNQSLVYRSFVCGVIHDLFGCHISSRDNHLSFSGGYTNSGGLVHFCYTIKIYYNSKMQQLRRRLM